MHITWKLAVVATVLVSGPAAAETWRARSDLIATKSAGGCPKEGTVYTLELNGNTFVAADNDGKMFTITVPENGIIKEDYKSSSGNRLEMAGNVKTRHLETYSSLRGCWWNLAPVK